MNQGVDFIGGYTSVGPEKCEAVFRWPRDH
jgi:hypothetical protein